MFKVIVGLIAFLVLFIFFWGTASISGAGELASLLIGFIAGALGFVWVLHLLARGTPKGFGTFNWIPEEHLDSQLEQTKSGLVKSVHSLQAAGLLTDKEADSIQLEIKERF